MSDICITILALVNTYTLSKLIASISDSNAHAMLRSSIGSYVAVLPSRFTVAALYLFLLWIAMFIWDIFTGPIHMLFIVMVLLLFFHVIIPLSAFGRLIIHTGAMGRRPVLDVELEKELLPSGLHNSLLIRATDRKRKYKSSATDQYRKPPRSSRHVTTANSIPASTMYGTSCNNQQSHVTVSHRPPRDITLRKDDQDSDDLTMDDEEDHDVDGHNPLACNDGTNTNDIPSPTTFGRGYFEGFKGGHRRIETIDTVRMLFIKMTMIMQFMSGLWAFFLTSSSYSIVGWLGQFLFSTTSYFERYNTHERYSRDCATVYASFSVGSRFICPWLVNTVFRRNINDVGKVQPSVSTTTTASRSNRIG